VRFRSAACRSWRANILSPIFRVEGGSAQNRHLASELRETGKSLLFTPSGECLLGTILVVILIVFLLGGFSGRFGGYVSKEECVNSSDTQAVRQFDTNQLYSLPYLSRLFGYRFG